MSQLQLTDISINNDVGLISFSWHDGQTQQLAISKLRGMCPCAACQGHGKAARFIPNTVKSIKKADFVGRYAVAFTFGDGHNTGIYSWNFLREIAQLENAEQGTVC